MNTPQRLQTYIEAELRDAMLYRELARNMQNDEYRLLLLEFAEDEQSHAEEFQSIYRALTGRSYDPIVEPPLLEGTYRDILLERILDESNDYRKYGEQYIKTCHNKRLRDAYYRARTDENVHALRILYMLNG